MSAAELKSVPQQGFDEQVIEDEEIEAALDDREKKASLDAVRKINDGAHGHAMLKASSRIRISVAGE